MARRDKYTLNVQATTGTGTPLNVADLDDKWVQTALNGATMAIEGTIDGTNWVAAAGVSTTVSGVTKIAEGFMQVRANRTVQGTSAAATISGRSRSNE